MSETDSFIDEVTEDLRRDKLFATFRKYGWIGGVVVALIVGGAAYSEWQKSKARAEAESFGNAILSALETEDRAARVAALEGISADGGYGDKAVRGALLAFIAADDALKAGDAAGAAARLAAIATTEGLDQTYRDMAKLKWLTAAGASVDPAERDAALADLATPGRPFRALALEQQALALVADGKTDEAVTALKALMQEAEVPPGLLRRATQLIVALGGEPDAA